MTWTAARVRLRALARRKLRYERLEPTWWGKSAHAMMLSVGERLGRFEILGLLGAGGMGEVYRARDPQLRREVAIKVLPLAFAGDADRRRRFEQEARAAANLSHPNILAVYDVGLSGDASYIVTELLNGETLRKRIGARPLPARKIIEYAIQIASGLAAGHERGILHRDIKPDNLFVTTEGRLKILDFGLAKLLDDDPSASTKAITVDGIERKPVVGTAAYMSPEQALGQRVDHRSDIFSFGVVMHEMLTGVAPFLRPTTPETLGAILNDEPRELPGVAPWLDRLVRHCLEKKPEERFQNARDLVFGLETGLHLTGPAQPAVRARRLSGGRALTLAALVALPGAAALGYFAGARGPGETRPAMMYTVRPMSSFVGLEEFPAISPDGGQIAFTANSGGQRQILVRRVSGGPPIAVTQDDADHQSPRWSPDGSWLVYFSPASAGAVEGTIWKVPALGGASVPVMASIGGGDVSRAGRIAAFRIEQQRIQLVSASLDGSEVRVISSFPFGKYYRCPRWSPDARRIAFQAGDGVRWDVWWTAAEPHDPTRQPTQLTKDRGTLRGLAWLPDGSGIVYASNRGSAMPYLPPLGLWEVQLSDSVSRRMTSTETSYEQPDVHATGLVTAVRLQMRSDLFRIPFDRTASAKAEPMTQQTGRVLTPTAAPNGRDVAYLSDNGGHTNLWVTSADRGTRQITFEDDPSVTVGVPVWSPDGRWIAFVSSKGNTGLDFGIWLVRPDGGELRQLVKHGLGVAWSTDGQWLYFVEAAGAPLKRIATAGGETVTVRSEKVRNVIGVHDTTIYFMVEDMLIDGRLEYQIMRGSVNGGAAESVWVIPSTRIPPWQLMNPSLSPDGRWLAVLLTDGPTTNIWALSTENRRLQRVTDYGDRPIFIARRVAWSADGKYLYAAVGEGDADIVALQGLVGPRSVAASARK